MEKYGVKNDDLKVSLEERSKELTHKIASMRSRSEKTASAELPALEEELKQVRLKLSDVQNENVSR
jgi:hypothetical protein